MQQSVYHSLFPVLRCLILSALLLGLSSVLISRIYQERDLLWHSSQVEGVDPGIRVLLRQRERNADTHGQLSIFLHQDALLYNIAAPQEQWVAVSSGRTLHIIPHIDRGFLVASGGMPRDISWLGGPLRLVPDRHTHPQDMMANNAQINNENLFALLASPTIDTADGRPLFSIAGRRYRGSLDIAWVNARSLAAINVLPMESYLEGVLQSELNTTWPLETLKAQAVASRTYALDKIARGGQNLGDYVFHVRDSVSDQEYRGSGNGGVTIDWAINATRGQVLSLRGQVFPAYFHASSGGQLASVDAVFPGSTSADGQHRLSEVMIAQADPFCLPGVQSLLRQDSHWQRRISLSSGELRNRLREREVSAGLILRLDAERDDSGRVSQVRLGWAGGEQRMSAGAFRQLVGPQRLRSTLWSSDSPSQDEGSFVIVSYGWGHGVGMSQMSAYAMARFHGKNYRDILAFFYHNTEIMSLWR